MPLRGDSSSFPTHARIARDIPPHADSLLAILCRRLTFARYRKSPRFARVHSRTVGSTPLPVPLIQEQLAVYLADKLPDYVVARLGPAGVTRLATGVVTALKTCGVILRVATSPLRWSTRRLRMLRAWSAARRHRSHIESAYMSRRPAEENLSVLLDGRVLVEGFRADAGHARLWLRPVKPVTQTCQIFFHLFPENPDLLPEDRRIHGYLCKDHFPAVEPKDWRADRSFRDDISLADIPAGFYRIEAGMVEVGTFRRFPVSGSTRDSVDLGWVRIGSGGHA